MEGFKSSENLKRMAESASSMINDIISPFKLKVDTELMEYGQTDTTLELTFVFTDTEIDKNRYEKAVLALDHDPRIVEATTIGNLYGGLDVQVTVEKSQL